MKPLLLVAVVLVVIVILVLVVGGFLFPKPKPTDTETHSFEVGGYYGEGNFAGELLESDRIQTNLTGDTYSQSVVAQGRICLRSAGLGKVFLDGSRTTEPDAQYKYYVNGVLLFTASHEVGGASALTGCLDLPKRDYVITGQNTGVVRVELIVYVHSFERGAGAYEVLAYDQAILR